MNCWRRDRYKNLKLAYKLKLSSTSKINKSTNILYTIMDPLPCQTLRLLPRKCLFTWFCSILADWLNMINKNKTKNPKKVTNAYVCRLSLSLTWEWHSVSRRQCHGLKNKTTVPIITCNQLIRLRLISAIIYTNLLLLW